MMKPSTLLFMIALVCVAPICVADETPADPSAAPSLADLHAACDADIQKLCAGVKPGGGRILACLKQHQETVSDNCKLTVVRAVHPSVRGTT